MISYFRFHFYFQQLLQVKVGLCEAQLFLKLKEFQKKKKLNEIDLRQIPFVCKNMNYGIYRNIVTALTYQREITSHV